MNRVELQEALDAEEVHPRAYYIVGISKGGFQGHGELVLDRDGSRWVIYTTERGEDFDHEYFATEDEACQYVLATLREDKERSIPYAITREEEERARRIQERQGAQYEEWLRSKGRDPKTGRPVEK